MPPPPFARPPTGGRGIVVSAPSSGQGKTAVTLGLLRALRHKGVAVVSGKSGPDYIDPAFHAAASGGACATLDGWAFGADVLRAHAACAPDEVRIIEGAMGLFDGPVGPGGGAEDPVPGSTAHVASASQVPVILVLDARRMGQSAAAIVSGLNGWAEGIEIAGVILNRVASPRHAAMLCPGIERVCPVLGMLPDDARLAMPSRHLGLVQAGESLLVVGELLGHSSTNMTKRYAHLDVAAKRSAVSKVGVK